MPLKKLPNITFFSALPPFRGGIAQFSEELRKSLVKKTKVSAFTFRKQYPDFLFPGQTQFDEISTEFSGKRVVSTFRPWTYWRALRNFNQSNGSVFLTNYWMSFFGPMMGFWGRFLPVKTVKMAIIHNLVPHEKRFFDNAFNRFFLRSYDGFIVLSEAVKVDVLAVHPSAKVRVLKHPSYQQYGARINRTDACKKLGIDPSKQTILFFGLIRDYKGLDILLKAFSELDASFQLLIAGEVYGDRKLYTDLIASSKNAQIYFHDHFVPTDEVAGYFSAAHLCVLPYKSATQSGIKALCDAFHVPVLVSRVGGLAEEIVEGKTGFVINEMSEVSIAHQIRQIVDSNKLVEVQKNLELKADTVENEWDDFAQSVLDFSNQLAQSKN
jgi:glycosyltransferase involved in cell wall biosynthesis